MTPEELKARCIQDGDCLIWKTPYKGPDGPRVSIDNKKHNVRALVYGKAVPKGFRLITTCGHRLCIAHVAIRSDSWINKRGRAKTAGSLAYAAKMAAVLRARSDLSQEAVQRIRSSDRTIKEDAEAHNISEDYVRRIRQGQFRKDYSHPFAGLMT